MPSNRPLYKYIGDPITVITFSTHSSDGIAASDNTAGVPIGGYAGVLFLECVGAASSDNAGSVIQIQYSSTGNASDAATSNASMSCTDAVFAALSTDIANTVRMLDFSIDAKGLPDAGGKLFATVAAGETGAAVFGLIGIPYGGNRIWPATNAATVVVADD